MEPTGKPRTVVKCEKHGLHYDSARQSGCVICRREAGELPGAPAAAAARPAAGVDGPRGSIGAALAVTAVLIAVAAFAMLPVHATFIEWLRGRENQNAFETAASRHNQKQMEGALKELKEQSSGGGAVRPPGDEP